MDQTKRSRPGSALMWAGAFAAPLLLAACEGGEGEPVETVHAAFTIPYRDDAVGQLENDQFKVLANAPVASSACFLQGVLGPLRNSDTALQQVFVSNTANGTYWEAGMSTYDWTGKTVWFACVGGIRRSDYDTYYWSQDARDPSPTDMGPTANRICFLNAIDGWLYGGQESVRITISNGRWLLGGTYNNLHPYHLGAGATCFNNLKILGTNNEFSATVPSGGGTASADTFFPFNGKNICGLTRLAGGTSSDTSLPSALVRDDPSYPPNPTWFVVAGSNGTTVSAGARCMYGGAL